MDSDDILLIGLAIGGAYLIKNRLKPKTELEDFATYTPSGFQTLETSQFNPNITNIRIENKGQLTTYPLPDDLSAWEKHLIRIGAYDIEKDMLQFGIHQGAERKLRNWWQTWITK